MRENISAERSDFRGIVENGACFIDKTRLIRDLIDSKRYVTLVIRPERCGIFNSKTDGHGRKSLRIGKRCMLFGKPRV